MGKPGAPQPAPCAAWSVGPAGMALSLLALTVGCAVSPWLAERSGQPARQEEASGPPAPSARASGDEGPAPCNWIEWAGDLPSVDWQLKPQPADADWLEVRPLPPVGDDRPTDRPTQWASQTDAAAGPHGRDTLRSVLREVGADHVHYYSPKRLGLLAIGVGIASAAANTSLDATLRDNYQEDLRDMKSDEFFETAHAAKVLGDGYLALPVFAAAALAGSWYSDAPLGRGMNAWGQRSLRAVLVGAPPMLAMQVITGGSRPGESGDGSHWHPFEDDNGVSGHSFMGAVPFISAAKMTDDPFWKAAFYVGSTWAGLSRINDDRHYPSQMLLGWWMAYVAATAVDQAEQPQNNLTVLPVPMADGIGVGIEYRR